MAPLPFLIAGGILLSALLALRKFCAGRLRLPLGVVAAGGGIAVGFGFLYGLPLVSNADSDQAKTPWQHVLAPSVPASDDPPNTELHDGKIILTHSLAPGATLPEFSGQWLNGPAPQLAQGVVVLDIWADS